MLNFAICVLVQPLHQNDYLMNTSMLINKKIELLTYCSVGCVTALIYFGLIFLSIQIFNLNNFVGISIAYFFAVCFHFLANRFFTFNSTGGCLLIQWVRYLGLLMLNFVIMIIITKLLISEYEFSTYVSSVLSIFFTVIIGYFVSKFWVFKGRELM